MGLTSKGEFTIVHQTRLRSFLLPAWLHGCVSRICTTAFMPRYSLDMRRNLPVLVLSRGQCSSVAVSCADVA